MLEEFQAPLYSLVCTLGLPSNDSDNGPGMASSVETKLVIVIQCICPLAISNMLICLHFWDHYLVEPSIYSQAITILAEAAWFGAKISWCQVELMIPSPEDALEGQSQNISKASMIHHHIQWERIFFVCRLHFVLKCLNLASSDHNPIPNVCTGSSNLHLLF